MEHALSLIREGPEHAALRAAVRFNTNRSSRRGRALAEAALVDAGEDQRATMERWLATGTDD